MGKMRLGGCCIAVLVSLAAASIPSGPARAYTMEQQQACTGDAFKFCSAEIPNIDRITACMVRNKAQLSAACRAQFPGGSSAGLGMAAADSSGADKPQRKSSWKLRKQKKQEEDD